MRDRYSRGSTVRIYFDLIIGGLGAISQAPTVAIQRLADEMWFQASDNTWQETIVENPMSQLNSVTMPGRYFFDFDQTLDDEEDSLEYIVKKSNSGTPVALEYQDLVFGPMPAVTSPRLCSVLGTVFTGSGEPLQNALVRATMQPVFKDDLGRLVEADRVVSTYTTIEGDFDLALVRGGIFRIEVPAIGYDRKATIPDQDQVLLTDL